MKREWDMDKVSDGKRYTKDDYVPIGCYECKGCSSCCKGMGNSALLDPYDVYRLTAHFSCTIKELLETSLELNVVDGLILPNLKMKDGEEACFYLNEEGRCDIHSARPGVCRLFPLGRIYEDDTFTYFIQVHECQYPDKYDVKIAEWLGTDNLKKYEKYISNWHYFIKDWQKLLTGCQSETERKQMVMYLLMQFFNKPYDTKQDFYPQFYKRLDEAKELVGLK